VQTLRRTPLYDRHVTAGARMVPFAGWEMPVQYAGVIPEHRAVRGDAGVFDVSHMGELEVEGMHARDLLQQTLSNDIDRLALGGAQYTLLTTDQGGIVDDLIVYRTDDYRYLLIVNASNRERDFEWLREREVRGSDVRDVSDEYALLAVQGPKALERLVNRTGYTGEEGVELMTPAEDATALWDAVVARGITPTGLGARDTLRLEVCYPLHGNDIDEETDPISAGLGWVCALDTEFAGADVLRRVKEEGPRERLVAFVMTDKAIPRQGMPIDGGGRVTSGSHSPMLDVGIGLGYVPSATAKAGTELTVDVRGNPRAARIVEKPIYKKET
jgi:aminomethyltransferase